MQELKVLTPHIETQMHLTYPVSVAYMLTNVLLSSSIWTMHVFHEKFGLHHCRVHFLLQVIYRYTDSVINKSPLLLFV